MPPKFQPKVNVRVICGRTKRQLEFSVDIPIDGHCKKAFLETQEKLKAVFMDLDLLPGKKPKEKTDAQGDLQPESKEKTGAPGDKENS